MVAPPGMRKHFLQDFLESFEDYFLGTICIVTSSAKENI